MSSVRIKAQLKCKETIFIKNPKYLHNLGQVEAIYYMVGNYLSSKIDTPKIPYSIDLSFLVDWLRKQEI